MGVAGKSRSKVLLVRLDAIGDFILWLEAAAALRQLYPPETHHITLLANQEWSELASGLHHWDEVWPLDRGRFHRRRSAYRIGTLLRVAAARFDLAIQPTFSREKGFGDAIVRASRARERIGWAGDLSNMAPRHQARADSWYTRLVAAAPGVVAEVQRNAEFVRALGAADCAARPPRLERGAPGAGRPPAVPGEPYFVIAPAARFGIKRWPAERFGEVAARLGHATGWLPVICGAAGDEAVARAVGARPGLRALDLTGRTPLTHMPELLRRARIVIGNDTMAVHMAAAVGTPVVCIAGGGHWGRFIPYPGNRGSAAPFHTAARPMPCYHCNWQCAHPRDPDGAAPCVAGVDVEQVWNLVRRSIAARASAA